MEAMNPVFKDLADEDLLKKCLHRQLLGLCSQNVNDSVNSVIRNRLPKIIFVDIKTLHFGVYDAIVSFNDGNIVKVPNIEATEHISGKKHSSSHEDS